ncbi:MAG: ubiquinol-cytochrome c reductase iron-sulfur subunit [Planctomycetota bacterium]
MSEQPAWRQDFPIDVPQEDYVSRRDFTKFLVLTSMAFTVGQFWIAGSSGSSGPEPEKAILPLDDLPVGGAHHFEYPTADRPCLLLRPDADTLVAYDQRCTHLSCAVIPDTESGKLLCPCHHGSFDIHTGRPLAGPPRRPLPGIRLEVRDGVIWAVGIELRTV